MIRINLLPEDYRRTERTSPKVFASMLLSVVAVCAVFGWFGFVYFGELGKLEMELVEVTDRLNNLNQQVAYYDALSRESQDFSQRAKTIQQISKSRVLWTKALDELIQMVHNEGDIERHRAWFRSMTVEDGRGKVGPKVSMPGWVQGSELRHVADFHDDFERMPFFPNVSDKSLPSGDVNSDPTRTPAESLFFNLKWTFRPPQNWTK